MKKSILIVDDDKSLLSIFEYILDNADYKILTASNAEKCLEIIKSPQNIDLLFLDWKMPEVSGLQLYKSIQKLKPRLPVLLMTGYAVNTLINKALQEGIYGIIHKPFDIEEVLNIIKTIFAVQAPVI
ncbi:response regulator [Candidatus Margulisiibacteriota bacterium]